jgi:Alpha/beta hydrolase of unknown function (DUF900)
VKLITSHSPVHNIPLTNDSNTFSLVCGGPLYVALQRLGLLRPLPQMVSFLLLFLMIVAGCSSTIELMPTPNLYANCHVDPFPNVPPALQNNHADVLYFTDRTEAKKTPGGSEYGFGRSRSIAFGISRVEFGKDISWEELKKASRTNARAVDLAVTVPKRTELVRFPPTPRLLIHILGATTEPTSDEAMLGDDDEPDELADEGVVLHEISAQLAVTPSKEVFLFIHGYNNNFDDSV